MQFNMSGKDQKNIEIVSLSAVKVEDMPKREKDGVPKLVEGKETYSLRGATVLENGQSQRSVYISLFTPQAVERFKPYRLDGQVIVNVYSTRDGAITTITAERLVPVESGSEAKALNVKYPEK